MEVCHDCGEFYKIEDSSSKVCPACEKHRMGRQNLHLKQSIADREESHALGFPVKHVCTDGSRPF